MNRFYLKNQWFYILVAFAFFCYALFFYIQNTEKNSALENHIIIEKRCSAAPRITSFVKVKKGDKTYIVNLQEQECVNYSIGDKIELNYNKEYDYFFIPSMKKAVNSRIIFSSLALLLSLFPWRYLFKIK